MRKVKTIVKNDPINCTPLFADLLMRRNIIISFSCKAQAHRRLPGSSPTVKVIKGEYEKEIKLTFDELSPHYAAYRIHNCTGRHGHWLTSCAHHVRTSLISLRKRTYPVAPFAG